MSEKATIPTTSAFSAARGKGQGQIPTDVSTQPSRSGVKTQRNLRNATRMTSNGVAIAIPPTNPNPGKPKQR